MLREACETCRKLDAMEDMHAPAAYRQHLATVMARRAIEQARARLPSRAAAARCTERRVMGETRKIALTVNGKRYEAEAEVRLTLADFLRHTLGLTGTHLGCEHGVCGACTILLDGRSARSCLMLAVQADGHEITTVEGLAPSDDELSPLQEAFRDNHGLQCGFCTPGMLTTLTEFLRDNPDPTEHEVRVAISGNLCRCTGYQGIVAAALDAAKRCGLEKGGCMKRVVCIAFAMALCWQRARPGRRTDSSSPSALAATGKQPLPSSVRMPASSRSGGSTRDPQHPRQRRNSAGGDFRQRRNRDRPRYHLRHGRFRRGRAGARDRQRHAPVRANFGMCRPIRRCEEHARSGWQDHCVFDQRLIEPP